MATIQGVQKKSDIKFKTLELKGDSQNLRKESELIKQNSYTRNAQTKSTI